MERPGDQPAAAPPAVEPLTTEAEPEATHRFRVSADVPGPMRSYFTDRSYQTPAATEQARLRQVTVCVAADLDAARCRWGPRRIVLAGSLKVLRYQRGEWSNEDGFVGSRWVADPLDAAGAVDHALSLLRWTATTMYQGVKFSAGTAVLSGVAVSVSPVRPPICTR